VGEHQRQMATGTLDHVHQRCVRSLVDSLTLRSWWRLVIPPCWHSGLNHASGTWIGRKRRMDLVCRSLHSVSPVRRTSAQSAWSYRRSPPMTAPAEGRKSSFCQRETCMILRPRRPMSTTDNHKVSINPQLWEVGNGQANSDRATSTSRARGGTSWHRTTWPASTKAFRRQ